MNEIEPSKAETAARSGAARQRVVMRALLAGLILSLLANFFLVRANEEYFKQVSAVRLDPPGLKFYATQRAVPPPQNRPVVAFFGDSRALMWALPKGLPNAELRDLGVGNQTTAQVLLRFDDDVARLKPKVVVLEAGVNDLKTIAEFPSAKRETIETCKSNLARLVAKARKIDASVVLVTVFAIGDVSIWRRPFWSSEIGPAVDEVNRFVRTLGQDGVVVLDADPILDDARGKIDPRYQYDFLHLAPAGYAALNERLVPIVQSLLH